MISIKDNITELKFAAGERPDGSFLAKLMFSSAANLEKLQAHLAEGRSRMSSKYECGCEHGMTCTRTTMCKVQSAVDELEAQLETANADKITLMRHVAEGLQTQRKLEAQLADTEEAQRLLEFTAIGRESRLETAEANRDDIVKNLERSYLREEKLEAQLKKIRDTIKTARTPRQALEGTVAILEKQG